MRMQNGVVAGLLAWSVLIAAMAGVHTAEAADLKPLYHEGFDKGAIEGKIGKGAPSLSISAPGKIDLDRGTLAFFVKTDKLPGIDEWNILGGVLPQGNTGYWGMLMGFDIRKGNFLYNFYDGGLYCPHMPLGRFYDTWTPGVWHHLAAVWDRRQGVTVYVDGKRAASTWGEYQWEWNLYPETLFVSFPVDEVNTFAEALTDAQIAQLANGQAPTGDPLPEAPLAASRAMNLAQMGWDTLGLAQLPVVSGDQPQTLTFARVVSAMDSKRPVAQVTEGYPGDTWPLLQYGAAVRGKLLDLQLAPGSSFDHVRVQAMRPFIGGLNGADGKSLTSIQTDKPAFWQRNLGKPVTQTKLALTRAQGRLQSLDFYRVDKMAKPVAKELETFHFQKAAALPDNETGQALLADTPARLQQFALGTAQPVAAWQLTAPAMGGFQATTDIPKGAKAYDGAVVTLVAAGLNGPTPVRIQIKEPVLGLRDWLVGDAVLQPRGTGQQSFTVFLKGRPVINMPTLQKKKYWKDGIYLDEMLPIPGIPFGIKVTAGNAVTWVMGQGGTNVAFHTTDMAKALPAATDDQVTYMREAYSQMMEGHAYGDTRMVTPTRWLSKFAPGRMEFRQMYERMGRPQWYVNMNIPEVTYNPPKNTTGAPEWAFWQLQVMNEHRRLTHWEIDNLQLDNGEMGGVWNDDTDHWENAIDYILCMDDDHKILNSYRKFIDHLYNDWLEDGVGKYVQDSLHYYEEGMGVLSMRMLVDYGDPVTFNRTLAAASHASKWAVQKDGKWYQQSVFISPNEMWLEGDFDVTNRKIPLSEALIPGGYLYWYNGFPSITKYFDSIEPRTGVFLSAVADRMHGLEEARKDYEKSLQQPLGRYRAMYPNAWMDEVGVSEAVKKAHAVPFKAPGPIANYEGMTDTDEHWFRYKTTGDIRWLSESYKRTWEWFQRMDWIVTEARPSLDRNPLPRYALIRARCGSLPTHRGGTGGGTLRYPYHGISYTKGADDVAALVYENLDTKLAARFYAFTDKPHDMQIRFWRLNPGTYQLTLAHDANDDGVGEGNIVQKEITVDRGTYLDLTLPAREACVLTVNPIKTTAPNTDRPDPAISGDTVEFIYGEHMIVRVFNLGSKPAENVVVRVRDGRTGRLVVEGEQVIPRIDAPLDFKPKQKTVEFKNINANTYESIIVEIDPDGRLDDLNRFNNRFVVDHTAKGWTQ